MLQKCAVSPWMLRGRDIPLAGFFGHFLEIEVSGCLFMQGNFIQGIYPVVCAEQEFTAECLYDQPLYTPVIVDLQPIRIHSFVILVLELDTVPIIHSPWRQYGQSLVDCFNIRLRCILLCRSLRMHLLPLWW